jgi:hypothetical protein
MTGVNQSPSPGTVDAEAVMETVRQQLRTDLRSRLVLRGAAEEFSDQQVFDDVDRLFRRALAQEDRGRLLMPELFDQPWVPDLALRLSTHRTGGVGAAILFVKRRVLLPLTRWLFEYAQENFRRQDRVNVALMACLQSLAAEQAAQRMRLASQEADVSPAGARTTGGATPADPRSTPA